MKQLLAVLLPHTSRTGGQNHDRYPDITSAQESCS